MSAKQKRAAVRPVTVLLLFAGNKVAQFDMRLQPGENAVIDLNPETIREVLTAYDVATGRAEKPASALEVVAALPAGITPPPRGKPD